MGWDSIKYRNRHDVFRDSKLWTLRHFFLEEAKALAQTNPDVLALRWYFEKWDWLGPGVVVGIDLDLYVTDSPSREALVIELLDRTIERLRRFGSVIPHSYLIAYVNTLGFSYTTEQPIEPFVSSIQRIRNLITPHE